MALVKCWECSKEISDSAANCPHCGAAQHRGEVSSKPKSGGWWKWAIGLPVGGFALLMVIGAMNSNPEKTQARRAYETCMAESASADRARSSTSSFVASTCERMRADFVAKYGVTP